MTRITLVFLLCFAGLVVGLTGLSWHGDHVACLRLHEQTTYDTRMVGTMWGGECYLQVDGRWIPEQRWRMLGGGQ